VQTLLGASDAHDQQAEGLIASFRLIPIHDGLQIVGVFQRPR
jgi:hypothetical protein